MPCYVLGLGANIDSPQQQLSKALGSLKKHRSITLFACSSLYKSPALTHADNPELQPDFFNLVVAIDCHWHPEKLLTWIHLLEYKQGRQRRAVWQARPLDIDVLLCSTISYSSNRLRIPHPSMHIRDFVVRPLLEIKQQLPTGMQKLCPPALAQPNPKCHRLVDAKVHS